MANARVAGLFAVTCAAGQSGLMFAPVRLGFSSPRAVALFLFLSLLAVLTTSALAQPKDNSGKRLEAIRAEMERGQGLYVSGNYAAAAQVFRRRTWLCMDVS